MAILTLKAVVVSKIAFVLALILAAQKFLGGGIGSGFNLFGKVSTFKLINLCRHSSSSRLAENQMFQKQA